MTAGPYAPFRPRATRLVSFGVIGWLGGGWMVFVLATRDLADPATHVGAGLLVALISVLLVRLASLAAIPDARGLFVRNVVSSRRVDWAQIVGVRFGERDWVSLDLSDGSVLAVMAIQRVDGERARKESRRLAALVARHEPGGMDAGDSGR
ncbi:PH domain-containing protein [Ruania halotolerans]|uniref:PH domain-containing protein n=1 Tax=Ruania halotolerans TaxID=2897773 RepID=UPI001E2E0413|nr:PH domain-containing protein [Ruania halotolerans]UFU08283.1 PH domain-containing protein [Ruania halotolerans]